MGTNIVIAQVRAGYYHLPEGVERDVWFLETYGSEIEMIDSGYETLFTGSEPVEVLGNLKTLKLTDMPATNLCRNLISKKFLQALLSVGNFNYRAIPVRIYSYPVGRIRDRYNIPDSFSLDKIRDKPYTDDFVLLQLFDLVDLIDLQNSTPHDGHDFSNSPESVSVYKYVFHQPEIPLPPIFRLRRERIWYWVSLEAKAALEAAGVQSVEFILRGGQYERDSDKQF